MPAYPKILCNHWTAEYCSAAWGINILSSNDLFYLLWIKSSFTIYNFMNWLFSFRPFKNASFLFLWWWIKVKSQRLLFRKGLWGYNGGWFNIASMSPVLLGRQHICFHVFLSFNMCNIFGPNSWIFYFHLKTLPFTVALELRFLRSV